MIPFCRCGRVAYWHCKIHEVFYCKRCGCSDSSMAHKQHREPLDHISGAMKEIMHNLWLGDRFDAELIQHCEDRNYWVTFTIGDYPENEFPNHIFGDAVRFFSIFGAYRDPVKYPYGSDWHEDKELQVDIQILDTLDTEIRDALMSGNKVLVHCVGGIHRSPLVVAWFMYREGYVDSVEEAYDIIIAKRPEVQRRTYWLPEEHRDLPKAEDFE